MVGDLRHARAGVGNQKCLKTQILVYRNAEIQNLLCTITALKNVKNVCPHTETY